jgi:putative FmdB family regulatory protein
VPTYELICRACGHRFELFSQRMLRPEELVCERCASEDVEKGLGGGFNMPKKKATGPSGDCSAGAGGFG